MSLGTDSLGGPRSRLPAAWENLGIGGRGDRSCRGRPGEDSQESGMGGSKEVQEKTVEGGPKRQEPGSGVGVGAA